MIEVTNLYKNYGNIHAVKKLNFTVNKGEIVGFLGPNGAGKSTTMNMITGFTSSSGGTVKVCGIDIQENPREAKKNIGYLPEIPPLYVDMTVDEYLSFIAKLKLVDKSNRKEHINEILSLTSLTDVRKRVIKNLSKGYKQRTGIAQALIGNPGVLILDEPTVGLDPNQIIEVRNLIKSLGKDRTVILSSHILTEINAVCDRVIIIKKGEIVTVDTPSNLSEKFKRSAKVSVTVSGTGDIIKTLLGTPGIKSVNEAGTGKETGISSYEIESLNGEDVRGIVSSVLINSGFQILELKTLDVSLEDIFINLTSSNEEALIQ